jgi:hypothetical protein
MPQEYNEQRWLSRAFRGVVSFFADVSVRSPVTIYNNAKLPAESSNWGWTLAVQNKIYETGAFHNIWGYAEIPESFPATSTLDYAKPFLADFNVFADVVKGTYSWSWIELFSGTLRLYSDAQLTTANNILECIGMNFLLTPESSCNSTITTWKGVQAGVNQFGSGLLTVTNFYNFYSKIVKNANTTITNGWHFYGLGDYPSYFGGTVQADKGFISTAVTLEATSTEITGNTIVAGINSVNVGSVDTDANDFIVLPSLANVEVGHTIKIACNAGSNFEMRTPSTSGEKINTVVSDGTAEYLCTDTEMITITKVSDTDGWVATAQTALGAIATAVVPD